MRARFDLSRLTSDDIRMIAGNKMTPAQVLEMYERLMIGGVSHLTVQEFDEVNAHFIVALWEYMAQLLDLRDAQQWESLLEDVNVGAGAK